MPSDIIALSTFYPETYSCVVTFYSVMYTYKSVDLLPVMYTYRCVYT